LLLLLLRVLCMSGVTVNKRELATRVLKCSIPKVDSLLARYPEMPVEQRGDLGSEWKFNPQHVLEFLRTKREEEERASPEKIDFLAQLELGIDQPEEARGLSPSQRLSLVRARREERRLAIESGMLVEVAKVRQELTYALTRLGSFLNTLPVTVARSHNLPEDVMRSMVRLINDQRKHFVAEIEKSLKTSDGGTPK
jgi:phage terminase Nu1 subunit (DNA packaging protein)